jgi:hypothetical protein
LLSDWSVIQVRPHVTNGDNTTKHDNDGIVIDTSSALMPTPAGDS